MTKIKNVRAGIVIVADAGLKLAPGETVSVDRLTAQMQSAIGAGLLARIDSDGEGRAKPKNAPKAEETKQEPTESGPSAPVEDGAQPAASAAGTDKNQGDGAPVETTSGVKRGGK